ncbi:MAG: YicC family protein [Bacteroidetes bacterium]|nr:YicC family protein [Bacteroidota bacterium]
MIRSMTGFGKATGSAGSNMITVEVKSLNSKFLELNLRIPSVYKDKDLELRNEISKNVERGKVDFIVTIEQVPGARKSAFNKDIIKTYFEDFTTLKKDLKLSSDDYLSIIMRLPNVLNLEKTEADPKEWKTIEILTRKALKEFNDFRIKEGKALQKDFEIRLSGIKESLKKIEKIEPDRIKSIKGRLNKGLEGLDESGMIDKNRFEQELVYYIEKIDISEEKVRLRSHLSFFMDTLKDADSNGKKLGFIIQEIGREINTIGSKANDANIQRHVVVMKDELEKMKEQAANII